MKFFLIPDMITAPVMGNGNKYWYKDGKLHREDGPAVIFKNGDQQWYKEGRLHREDGPAVGPNYYLIHGRCKTQKVLEWAEQCDIDLGNMSESDKLLLKIFINNIGDNYES